MAKMEIHNLGPITECTMEIDNFTVLTGIQASGKSTVAKSVYFCRTVKDDIYEVILKRALLKNGGEVIPDVMSTLRNKFLQLFGTSKGMSPNMKLRYEYADDTYMEATLKLQDGAEYLSPSFVEFKFSQNIIDFLEEQEEEKNTAVSDMKNGIIELFHDAQECIFIPAGRSLITLLTSQLNYMFATMDDEQKRSIDFCTQKYIERILKIRPQFTEGTDGLIAQRKDINIPGAEIDMPLIKEMLLLIEKVLRGKYKYSDNEERLYLDESHFIKINYTSSGQQETVWIFNILLHLVLYNRKAFIILEEPEAHLYPQAQKDVVELLALVYNQANSIFLTTHSPYILGALNNLIYANYLSQKPGLKQQVCGVIGERYHVKNDYNAYYLQDGKMQSCIEDEAEGGLIVNEVIDGASVEINELYEKLFDLEYQRGESL